MPNRLTARRRARALSSSKRTKTPAATTPRIVPTKLTAAQRAGTARGWFVCCGALFYAGFGFEFKGAPCPRCSKRARAAKEGELEDRAPYGEKF